MKLKRLQFALPLATTCLIVGIADVAFADIYDARTLGMGGNAVGYAGNASLAYWNPAAVARGNSWGVYLPGVSASLSTNALGVQDITGLGSGLTTGLSTIFEKLGSSTGANIQVQNLNELTGFSLGKVGPGSIAVRLYNSNSLSAQVLLSSDLSQDLDSLLFDKGLESIQGQITKLSASAANQSTPEGQEQFKQDVIALRDLLNTHMKNSFFKIENGRYNGKGTEKVLNLNAVMGANAALAATYAQAVPVTIPQLPEAELTVGATAKVLGSFGPALTAVPVVGTVTLPGAGGATLSPLGGRVGADVRFNMDKEVTELYLALEDFAGSQDLATGANVIAKAGAFANTGLGQSKIAFSSTTPSPVGLGMDFGAAMKLNKQWSIGAALADPLLLWRAKKVSYDYSFSDAGIEVKSTPEDVWYREGAPMIARVGVAFTPELAGPPILVNDLMLVGGVEAPFFNSVPASINLGVEKLFGPLALRLGTQQGGLSPLYTGGLGLQTSVFQLQLGAGVSNPGDLRGAAFALSMGAGF